MLRKNLIILVLFFMLPGIRGEAQTLNFYIEKGLENSPLLKDFKNKLLSGKLDSLLIQASYKPQVNQVSQAMVAPYSGKFGYDESITNGANYSAVLNVVQPLFNKKIRNNQFQENILAQKATENDIRLSETELKQGITSQYLAAYADLEQVRFNQSILEQLKKEQDLMKPLVEKGIYAQTDALNLSVSVTAQKIAIKQASLQYHNNLAILNFICGINDTTTVYLQKPELRIFNSFDIQKTPAMAKFKLDSLKTENARRGIDLNYRPRLSAFADAGFMAILPENIPHNVGASIGLNFSLPVYDGKQRKLQYEKLQLDENSRLDYKAFYIVQFKQQYNQLLRQLRETEELISNIRNQLTEQEKLIELYKVEIEKGLVRFTDFLNILNSYAQTKNNLTTAEMGRLQIINQMNYLR